MLSGNRSTFILILALVLCLGHATQGSGQEADEERRGEQFVFIDPQAKRGFMFGLNLGYFLPNDDPAVFYDGSPKGQGFLDLQEYLQIDRIRNEVLQELGNPSDFTLVEYASDMPYVNSLAVGAHVRYQFNWYHSLVVDANFISLKADDFFVLSYPNDNGTSQDIFQNFPIQGKEDRLNMNLGYQFAWAPPGAASMHMEIGPEMTSIRVKSNTFSVGSRTYSILRAQTVGGNNQVINNSIPTQTFFGAYAQIGANLEFDKFTMDIGWRTSFQKISLYEAIEPKRRLNHMPMARLVYRLSVKGF
ncbi:MAG: hypothetical protein HKN79_12685 [Flavobacteriales bacterium]|nr:hypothetical protein [Flavobacteriales bacterium]